MGGIVDGIFGGAKAAKKAASAAAAGKERGIGVTQDQFDRTQANIAPFLGAGTRALAEQESLLGLQGTDRQQESFQNFAESPGQAFLRERQERSLVRNQAAIGGLGGGNVRTALQEQAAGIASTQLGDFQNRLAGLSSGGQNAALGLGQLGANSSGNIASLLAGQGQDRASGILGAQQANAGLASMALGAATGGLAGGGAFGSGLASQFGGSAGNGALMGLMSDRDKKYDINDLDLKACFDAVMSMPLKSWRYLEEVGLGEDEHLGPMYQEAPDMIKVDGHKMLDLHDELMMIAGAIQHMKNEGITCRR